MINVVLCGALGKMGRIVADEIFADDELNLSAAVEASDHEGLGTSINGAVVTHDFGNAVSKGDIVVDFTNHEAALEHITASAAAGKPIVVGTTGFSAEELEKARGFAHTIPLLISPNMSAGVNLLFKITRDVAKVLSDFDIEITEIHHNQKKDAPSGTAAKIAEVLREVRRDALLVHGREGMTGARQPEEIGVHSLRGGDVVGEHTVIFAGNGERLELTHRAHSRRTFARGAIKAIKFLLNKDPGFYTMQDVLGLKD